MTEDQWLACTDPRGALAFLCGRASDRKLRLFAVACCRGLWGDLLATSGRAAIAVAERYADGLATDEERDAQDRAPTRASRAHTCVDPRGDGLISACGSAERSA